MSLPYKEGNKNKDSKQMQYNSFYYAIDDNDGFNGKRINNKFRVLKPRDNSTLGKKNKKETIEQKDPDIENQSNIGRSDNRPITMIENGNEHTQTNEDNNEQNKSNTVTNINISNSQINNCNNINNNEVNVNDNINHNHNDVTVIKVPSAPRIENQRFNKLSQMMRNKSMEHEAQKEARRKFRKEILQQATRGQKMSKQYLITKLIY